MENEPKKYRQVFEPEACLVGIRRITLSDLILNLTFFYEVSDDAMSGINIPQGSIVAILPKPHYRHGDIVLIEFDGKVYLRQFIRSGKQIELRSKNINYKTINIPQERFSDFRIIGEVEFSFCIHCHLDERRAKMLRTLLKQK